MVVARGRELTEGVVCARPVDGGGPPTHEEGDPDRLRRLLACGAGLGGRLGVRGDASVAALDHRDREGDELLAGASSAPGANAARCSSPKPR